MCHNIKLTAVQYFHRVVLRCVELCRWLTGAIAHSCARTRTLTYGQLLVVTMCAERVLHAWSSTLAPVVCHSSPLLLAALGNFQHVFVPTWNWAGKLSRLAEALGLPLTSKVV